jgi:hypothetical protein
MSAVPVYRMVLLSGRDTVIGGRLLTEASVGHAVAVRKCPVLPVSAMALKYSGGDGGSREGGPVMDKQEVDAKICLVIYFWCRSIGSPRRQRGAGGVAGPGIFPIVHSFLMFWMMGQPPRQFASVAVLQ